MKHYNFNIGKIFQELFNVKSGDMPTSEVLPVITPTKEIQPFLNIIRTTSSSGTVWTTPTDQDFYLTNVSLNCAGDTGTPLQGNGSFNATAFEGNTIGLQLQSCTDTTGQNALSITFPLRGVKLKRGTTITTSLTNAFLMFAGYTE